MIEKMHRLSVICLAGDKHQAVERLRQLGSVHVMDTRTPESRELTELNALCERAERALLALLARDAEAEAEAADSAKFADSAEKLTEQVLELMEKVRKAEERIVHWNRAADLLKPWGSFSRKQFDALAAAGIKIVPGCLHESQLAELELPAGCVLHEISRHMGIVYFMAIAPETAELQVPEVTLPEETSLERIQGKLAQAQVELDKANHSLDELKTQTPVLEKFTVELHEHQEMLQARDGMGETSELAYLHGFIPAKNLAKLHETAKAAGWAVQDEAAELEDTEVPTLITLPRLFTIAKPIFDFIGIFPKYSEADVSVCFLLFLTVFFGMIVGDAGYGLLFLIAGFALKSRIRAPKKQLPVKLLLVMAAVTLGWGWLNGNFFAIPAEKLPRFMRGIDALTKASIKDQNVQWLCFLIGALHLSIARIWKAFIGINRKDALGHVGWAMLIWANFFMAVELIVRQGSFPNFGFYLYGIGGALILVFGVNWKDIGGILNLPFGLIGSFVDVLSYIRLFAVGLSSYFIAASFNDMGKMVFDISPWLLPAAVLVIFFGHTLNILLALMGVLVHGIRLNTLEFSNHMEMTWAGHAYKPLRCKEQPATGTAD